MERNSETIIGNGKVGGEGSGEGKNVSGSMFQKKNGGGIRTEFTMKKIGIIVRRKSGVDGVILEDRLDGSVFG